MPNIFFIPDTSERKGNEITTKDIENKQLRVGVSNKKHFPHENCEIKIIFNNVEYSCSLEIDLNRSYRIKLKDLANKLNLKSTDQLEFQRIDDKKYLVSK